MFLMKCRKRPKVSEPIVKKKELDLGSGQGYMGLIYHAEKAYQEQIDEGKLDTIPIDKIVFTPIAIFSKEYYKNINELNHNKKYDFCFIGSISSCPPRRMWVIDFAKKHFTNNSIFVNTDNDPNWKSLGSFDISYKKLGFCPKQQCKSDKEHYRTVQENHFYYESLCQSMFVLCPAGDSTWSFRFYETLMCKSIPIVESWHHTYRTVEESEIPYQYFLSSNMNNVSVDNNGLKKIISAFNTLNPEKIVDMSEINNIYNSMISNNNCVFENYHILS